MNVSPARIPVFQAPIRQSGAQHFVDVNQSQSLDVMTRQQHVEPEWDGEYTGRFITTFVETTNEPTFPPGFISALQTEPGDYSKELIGTTQLEQSVWLNRDLSPSTLTVDQFVKKVTKGEANEWILRVTPETAQLIAYKSVASH